MPFQYSKTFFVLIITILFIAPAFAQTSEREKGIELVKSGSYQQALTFLNAAAKQKEYKNDGEIWNALGIAYYKTGQLKLARKSLEKAVKLKPGDLGFKNNLILVYLDDDKFDKAKNVADEAVRLDPQNLTTVLMRARISFRNGDFAATIADTGRVLQNQPEKTAAYILKANALLYSFGEKWSNSGKSPKNFLLLDDAKTTLENCQKICPADAERQTVSEMIEAVDTYRDYFKNKLDDAPLSEPVVIPANETSLTITSKPLPRYTDTARTDNVTGSVRILLLFSADGRVRFPVITKHLAGGLDQSALNAALSIRFEPRKIDGKSVSVVKEVEFSFSIY